MPPKSLTFLSWNLCMLNRSDDAPVGWREDQTESKIRERVLELSADIVCFQELPGMVPFVETHDLVPANTMSHSGTIASIANKRWMETIQAKAIGRFAVLSSFPSLDLTVANVHLAPTRDGAAKRRRMLEVLVERCPTKALLVVGDTNTRVGEVTALKELGLTGAKPPSPTWDSRKNGYRRSQAPAQSQRSFSAYFTRYFHNKHCSVDSVRVFDQPIEADGKTFFLSDHFALSGTVTVAA